MMSNPMIKWGLYYGLASIAFMFISYFVSKDMLFGNWVSIIISLVLAVGGVVLAMKEERLQQEGYLGFGEAMKIGLGVFVLGGLLAAMGEWVLYNFIDTSLIQAAIDHAAETTRESAEWMADLMNAPDEVKEEMNAKIEEEIANIGNPAALSMMIKEWLLGSLIIGLPLNLIVAAIMKKS